MSEIIINNRYVHLPKDIQALQNLHRDCINVAKELDFLLKLLEYEGEEIRTKIRDMAEDEDLKRLKDSFYKGPRVHSKLLEPAAMDLRNQFRDFDKELISKMCDLMLNCERTINERIDAVKEATRNFILLASVVDRNIDKLLQ